MFDSTEIQGIASTSYMIASGSLLFGYALRRCGCITSGLLAYHNNTAEEMTTGYHDGVSARGRSGVHNAMLTFCGLLLYFHGHRQTSGDVSAWHWRLNDYNERENTTNKAIWNMQYTLWPRSGSHLRPTF